MQRPNGRMLFYTRDSGGKHETTPQQYVAWAATQARSLNLNFDGCPADLQELIDTGHFEKNDIYLDYDVCGNTLKRPGLDAMFARLESDESISHVAIPRRDRLTRPDSAIQGLLLEERFNQLGVTIVYTDKVVSPTPVGERRDPAEIIYSVLEHDASGKFRRVHAEKMLWAQLTLAQNGFSTGGRAPYGFRRYLVSSGGTVRQLEDGESVKMPGHHVVCLPGPEDELNVIRLILELLKTKPASQVAKILNQRGIPSPNAGRYRTDHGRRHQVMPIWRSTSVMNIARNPLLVSMTRYGLRSMGDQVRFSKTGPRSLTDADIKLTSKPGETTVKVIRNSVEEQISVQSTFEPLIDPQEYRELQELLNQRAGTQRGKPRSVDPLNNPLGCRIFDAECGWPMYRQPYSGSYRYLCGLYQQSSGHSCSHNHVPGPQAARLAMNSLQQQLTNPKNLARVRQIIRNQIQAKSQNPDEKIRVSDLEHHMIQVEGELRQVSANLARAKNQDQFDIISKEFEKLTEERNKLFAEMAKLKSKTVSVEFDEEGLVARALERLEKLGELVGMPDCREAVLEAIQTADVKMFVRFKKVQQGKRTVNKVAGGTITLGDEPSPIKLYTGATDRKSVSRTINENTAKKTKGPACKGQSSCHSSSCEDDSLGNVSRGERI